jgi:inosose dehydratase
MSIPSVLGAQSFSFREFDLDGALACLSQLGLSAMEFCGVHFPADVDDPEFAAVKERIAAANVTVPCYGVEGFSGDAAANRAKFEFAQALGAQVLTADPAPESFDNLEELCEEFQIAIAIHNHGPSARYDKVEDTLNAVEGRHPLIGACVDTGHSLRSDEAPHEVIRALGTRVISLHIKDWNTQDNKEIILGQGAADLEVIASALRSVGFDGPVMMEYEESPSNPVPDMQQGFAAWQAAWDA